MTFKFFSILLCFFMVANDATLLATSTKRIRKSSSKKIRKPKKIKEQTRQNPHPNLFLKDMNEAQLKEMFDFFKEMGDQEQVYKTFGFLSSQTSDQNNLKNYKLELADYCFTIKEYERAALAYEDFLMMYPGSQESEYVYYKNILCSLYLSLEPCKDQTNTHKTIFLIDMYLKRATDQKYIDEVQTIRKQCRQRLFEHEVCVFEHYIKQKKHTSAQKRYEYIETNFKDIDQLDVYLVYFKKMQDLVKDPKKCPFLIRFNLSDAFALAPALPEHKAKSSLFFLA